jgi:hypothetical protein
MSSAALKTVSMGSCLEEGWSLYRQQVGWFAGAGLVVSTISAMATVATAGWAMVLGWVLLTPAAVGVVALADGVKKGHEPSLDLALAGFKNARAYALGLLTSVFVLMGLAALVLPGLVVAVGLVWATVALHMRQLAAFDAAAFSFGLVRDNLGLSVLFFAFACFMEVLGQGTILLGAFTLPFVVCAKVAAFDQIAPRG